MLSLSPEALIAWLNARPPELVWVLMLATCFASVLALLRLFGKAGLYVYMAVAVVLANLQVLKPVQFSVYADPVALGTVLFSSTYLVTDILNEHFGRADALRAVWLGFAALVLTNALMILTLGFAPMTAEQAGDSMAWALGYHDALAQLFVPAPALLAAGMAAYLISQTHDIWLYRVIGRRTGRRLLWLRNNASTMVSALIDNTVFSVLAWVVFAPQPIGLHALVFTYILGTYLLRVAVAALDTPFMYLAARCLPPDARRPSPPDAAAAFA